MFSMFNINFDSIYKKENSTKFTIIGILLLALGVISFFYKGIGIKLVSWSLGIALLFLAYLNLKNINELRRYAPKNEVAPFTRLQFIILVVALLLFIFPQKIQGLISSLFGAYFIINQIIKIIKGRNNPYHKLGAGDIFVLLFGFTLVFSPLFLSNFIASMLSLLIILIGVYLLSTGNKLKQF
ncbi:MAG: DUF308 domain-containing protein [Peptostreptococcaceae bacterium]